MNLGTEFRKAIREAINLEIELVRNDINTFSEEEKAGIIKYLEIKLNKLDEEDRISDEMNK